MYMSELRKYKPTPVKASDAQGHVQTFTAPKAPNSPEETDIANELKAYEDQTVEVEGQAAEAGGVVEDEDAWFVEEEEEDKDVNEAALP
jgi:F-type H+-transporting ATPase subunit h